MGEGSMVSNPRRYSKRERRVTDLANVLWWG
jgi:hypothetical protein